MEDRQLARRLDAVLVAGRAPNLHGMVVFREGQVVLQGGNWNRSQVIPVEWLDAAFTPRVSLGSREYGYQWYLGQLGSPPSWRFFAAMGNGDQCLIVLPDAKMIVATSAGNYDTANQGKLPDTLMNEVILPALQ